MDKVRLDYTVDIEDLYKIIKQLPNNKSIGYSKVLLRPWILHTNDDLWVGSYKHKRSWYEAYTSRWRHYLEKKC